MCHTLSVGNGRFLCDADTGLLHGLKRVHVADNGVYPEYWDEDSTPDPYAITRHHAQGHFVLTHEDAPCTQPVTFELPLHGARRPICVTRRVVAGIHISPFEGLTARCHSANMCLVAFHADDVLFYDGWDVSVRAFIVDDMCVELAKKHFPAHAIIAENTERLLHICAEIAEEEETL